MIYYLFVGGFLAIAGIYLIFTSRLSTTEKREIRRPRSVVIGVVTVALGLTGIFIAGGTLNADLFSFITSNTIATYIVIHAVPILLLVFLQQPKLETGFENTQTSSSGTVVTGLTWVVILITCILVSAFFIFMRNL